MSKKKVRRSGDPPTQAKDIVGTWVRDTTDDTPYPDEITFEPDGIYSGKKVPGSSLGSKLDTGVFDRVDDKSIRVSTATDREETFGVDVSDDALILVDEEGTELSYTRRPEGEASSLETAAPQGEADGPEGEAEAPEASSDATTEEWAP